MASTGVHPTTASEAIETMIPDQPRPVANHRPQNHSATTPRNATA